MFFQILFFLVYLFISWILVRFVFVFNSSKENKLNKKIIDLQEQLNKKNEEIVKNLIEQVKNNFENIFDKYFKEQETKILEKF
jgi:predicted PurR-regulated permease PerM